MGLRMPGIESIYTPIVSLGGADSDASNTLIFTPTANGRIVASYSYPWNIQRPQFAVIITTASVGGGALHLCYLVLEVGGIEVSNRLILKDTVKAITVPISSIQLITWKQGAPIPAGSQILLTYRESGTPGGTRAQFRIFGPIADKINAAGQYGTF